MRAFAPVGNGLVLAYVTGDDLHYVRGTNVVRVLSHDRERRYAAIGEDVRSAEGSPWPPEFDPPPLGGATRAAVVGRVSDLRERESVTELYARSLLVLALHQERSGAFLAPRGEDVVIAHALDMCGERGAGEAFFAWALEHRDLDGLLMWGLEQHLRLVHGTALRPRVEHLRTGPGPELAPEPPHLPPGGREQIERALRRRSSLDLFVTDEGVDLRAHALFLLAVHSLMPRVQGDEDFFFQHQARVQEMRRARALYAGAFHGGLCRAGDDPAREVEVRPDLEPAMITIEPAPRDRYRVRAETPRGTLWASDADPRPGGQEFALGTRDGPPDWIQDAVMYQVMVDRFARRDGALPPPTSPTALYGGTLDGITDHLDHIESLGCNTIWLTPVHRSPTHHGYDHEDFFEVEERYGGNAALTQLIEAAHSRHMRVVLDFVPNHTGRGHHLFRDAVALGGAQAELYRFWQWPHYYRCFFDNITLPELDTGSRRVQELLVGVAQRWVCDYGADGVRCDHVAGADPSFWTELRRGLREVKPDALVLGEATGPFDWLARYAGRLDAIFDFDFAHVVRQTFARGHMDALAFARWLEEHETAFPGLGLATLIDNHDMNRFLWMAGGSRQRLKLAATLLMTLAGMPVIYYGTEVGLTQRFDGAAENAEARLPMLWGADQDRQLLAHFQRLGRLRRTSKALRRGGRRTLLVDPGLFVYERALDGERVVVALNLGAEVRAIDLGESGRLELEPLGGAVVDGSGRDRLREDDVLGVGPD